MISMPKPCILSATKRATLPKPTNPSVFPCSSIPVNAALSHVFDLRELFPLIRFLAAAIIRPTVNSATEIIFDSGEFVT